MTRTTFRKAYAVARSRFQLERDTNLIHLCGVVFYRTGVTRQGQLPAIWAVLADPAWQRVSRNDLAVRRSVVLWTRANAPAPALPR
jgi:hypothetical protein